MPNIKIIEDEPERGCGFRKEGGLYLMSGGTSAPCGKLPFELVICDACGEGIKPARAWKWINPRKLMEGKRCELDMHQENAHPTMDRIISDVLAPCRGCVNAKPPERAGLLWIGEVFYPTPEDFLNEARRQGVSRRIPHLPTDFVVGETWVYFAHRKAVSHECETCGGAGFVDEDDVRSKCGVCRGTGRQHTPAIIGTFRPDRVEYVVKGDETEEELDRMEKRGLTLVKLVRSGKWENEDLSGIQIEPAGPAMPQPQVLAYRVEVEDLPFREASLYCVECGIPPRHQVGVTVQTITDLDDLIERDGDHAVKAVCAECGSALPLLRPLTAGVPHAG